MVFYLMVDKFWGDVFKHNNIEPKETDIGREWVLGGEDNGSPMIYWEFDHIPLRLHARHDKIFYFMEGKGRFFIYDDGFVSKGYQGYVTTDKNPREIKVRPYALVQVPKYRPYQMIIPTGLKCEAFVYELPRAPDNDTFEVKHLDDVIKSEK